VPQIALEPAMLQCMLCSSCVRYVSGDLLQAVRLLATSAGLLSAGLTLFCSSTHCTLPVMTICSGFWVC
jgi:hypothetical protein